MFSLVLCVFLGGFVLLFKGKVRVCLEFIVLRVVRCDLIATVLAFICLVGFGFPFLQYLR